jgi:hypothetical protein
VDYQLVPHHWHRHNAAKRAISTFKEHFVAGLASVDPYFPLHLWDRLLPQAELTLNLLRTSIQHPQLSAAAQYHGKVDYNKKFLPRQDARSLHMKDRQNGARRHPMALLFGPINASL